MIRSLAKPVTGRCAECGGDGAVDSGGVQPWGESIGIPCPACDGSGNPQVLTVTEQRVIAATIRPGPDKGTLSLVTDSQSPLAIKLWTLAQCGIKFDAGGAKGLLVIACPASLPPKGDVHFELVLDHFSGTQPFAQVCLSYVRDGTQGHPFVLNATPA